MEPILLEICADSPASALAAMEGGADRVELCSALDLGGLTPSCAAISVAVRELDIPVRVLIRPRGGDFCYSEQEVNVMCGDIRAAISLGAQGVVCGALDADGGLDREAMQRLMAAASGHPVTFHRAFDLARDPFSLLDELIEMGVDAVLTSGKAATAVDGAALLAELQMHAAGRIAIMAGCGLNSANIAGVALNTGVRALHLSARRKIESPMRYRASGVYMGAPDADSQYDYTVTDPDEVAACREALDGI